MRAIVCGIQIPVLMSQNEVGKVLGISGVMVGQIEKQALSKLIDGLAKYR